MRRVATREGVDEETGFEHVRAVFVALGAAVAPGELRDMAAFHDVTSQLPADYAPIIVGAN